jgi:CubicO group peptidase (beta-lactamase class C family)
MRYAMLALLLACRLAGAAPDEELLGRSDGYPYPRDKGAWANANERLKIGQFSHAEEILEIKRIASGGRASPLPAMPAAPPLRYQFRGRTCTLDDYLSHQRETGLLVIKDGKIVAERYQYERQPETRFISFSIAKSITATLVGIALQDGKIKSLDDTVVQYVPKLKDSPYGPVTVRNLLRMSSGTKFNYVKNGGSGDDSDTLNREILMQKGAGGVGTLSFIRESVAAQGARFHYSNADTFVLGLVLQAALGTQHLADYTSEKLWKPMGAEDGASWIVDWSGAAATQAGFNARLRDFGRLGVLWANDGRFNGRQIVDREFLLDATAIARQPKHLSPRGQVDYGMGYGYQFWLSNFKSRTFSALGAYGQQILVQPDSGIVIVMTAASRTVDEAIPERQAFIQGVIRSLGGSVETADQPASQGADAVSGQAQGF